MMGGTDGGYDYHEYIIMEVRRSGMPFANGNDYVAAKPFECLPKSQE
jgi:hypothetical protein